MTDISWVELLTIVVVATLLITAPKWFPRMTQWLRQTVRRSKRDADQGGGMPDQGEQKPGQTDPEADARDTDE